MYVLLFLPMTFHSVEYILLLFFYPLITILVLFDTMDKKTTKSSNEKK